MWVFIRNVSLIRSLLRLVASLTFSRPIIPLLHSYQAGFFPRSLTFFSSKWNRIGWNYTSQRRSFCGHTKCFTKQIASAEFIAQIVKSILVASESWNNVGGKKAYEWTAYNDQQHRNIENRTNMLQHDYISYYNMLKQKWRQVQLGVKI